MAASNFGPFQKFNAEGEEFLCLIDYGLTEKNITFISCAKEVESLFNSFDQPDTYLGISFEFLPPLFKNLGSPPSLLTISTKSHIYIIDINDQTNPDAKDIFLLFANVLLANINIKFLVKSFKKNMRILKIFFGLKTKIVSPNINIR